MRNFLFRGLVVFALPVILISGCAKDPVKPDEGLASSTTASADRSAADKAAADKAAADRAAADRAAADRAAADRAAADKAAAATMTPVVAETVKSPLKMINFAFDSYVLSQPARDILYNNADYLLKKYKGKVKLEGHGDERGSDEYNLALGEKRAKAALDYLVTLGVPSEQLSIISYGKERPLESGHNEESWAKNRRVEFVTFK